MRRLGYLLASLLVATALSSTPASADIEWCAEDPVFVVFNSNFRLTARVATDASNVDGFSWVVTLPRDAEGATTVQYPRSPRLPTTVELRYTGDASSEGAFGVSATVTVASSADAAVRVDLAGPSVTAVSFDGRTNKAVRAQFTVSR